MVGTYIVEKFPGRELDPLILITFYRVFVFVFYSMCVRFFCFYFIIIIIIIIVWIPFEIMKKKDKKKVNSL